MGNSISETIENIKTNNFDKEAHALIQKSRKLTASLEMKSYLTARFLSALSHDIRTSLTLIKGYSKGILSGLVEDEETKERFIQEIYRSADTLERISYDVLDSTYEAQNSEQIKMEPVSAETFCESLYQNAQAYVENSDRLFEGSLEKVEGELYISDVKNPSCMAEYAEQRSKIFGALFNGYDTDRLGKRKIPVPGIGSGGGNLRRGAGVYL